MCYINDRNVGHVETGPIYQTQISIEVKLYTWYIPEHTAGEFYLNIKPKFSGFDDTRGDKRHLKKQNKYIFNNYFATFVLKVYENIRGSKPKIAEKSRLVRI